MIQKGKRHLTVRSPALPRARMDEDEKTNPDLLSHAQLKRLMKRGACVYLASLLFFVFVAATCNNAAVAGSVSVSNREHATTLSEPTVQPSQPSDPVSSEKKWVSDLLSEFSDVFQDPLPVGLTPVRAEGHSNPTKPGHPPTFRQMYRLSPLEYRELEKQVTAFLKAGILEVSTSSYGAPVLFVPKPNGRGLRLCVDYRALNSITIKNRCTIPRIDDLLDAVSGSKYFTSLDLTSGYHQVLISEEDRPKTAFRTPWGHYQFKVLIEGLTNAPATFQSVMNKIFHPFLRRFVVVYLDDILIYSKTAEEHQEHVRLVLETLRRQKFYVCESKSSFANSETRFLGHVVSAEGIRPDPKKVQSVQDWPVPANVHDVRSFMGLVNYFRKFIKDFATLAAPLTDLTRAKHSWEWTDRCEQAFLALKHCLTEAPLLISPDVSKPYEVVTDASTIGIGAVLLQDNRPIAFESRKLSDAEKNYTTTEQEMLAVVHALK